MLGASAEALLEAASDGLNMLASCEYCSKKVGCVELDAIMTGLVEADRGFADSDGIRTAHTHIQKPRAVERRQRGREVSPSITHAKSKKHITREETHRPRN